MAIWIFAVVVIAVVAIAYVTVQQQKSIPAQPSEPPSIRRSIFNLQVGDIVQYRTEDWVVEGVLTYSEDGFDWVEYLLQEGDRIRWLSVEEDDMVEVSMQEPVQDLYLQARPAEEIRYKNVDYRLVESGKASMTRVGNTLQRQAQTCRYFDFEGPDNKVLSVEDWDGDWEVTCGESISVTDLTLLPGEGKSVYRDY
ncbi:MAG: DUF4178 domain-containing protein [Cyanobacteria bacterium P01_F01_bin.42]